MYQNSSIFQIQVTLLELFDEILLQVIHGKRARTKTIFHGSTDSILERFFYLQHPNKLPPLSLINECHMAKR